ncbi:MAG TPA: hypothetical protein VIF14_01985, partial [Alphaproteobacteria bacterium]
TLLPQTSLQLNELRSKHREKPRKANRKAKKSQPPRCEKPTFPAEEAKESQPKPRKATLFRDVGFV